MRGQHAVFESVGFYNEISEFVNSIRNKAFLPQAFGANAYYGQQWYDGGMPQSVICGMKALEV